MIKLIPTVARHNESPVRNGILGAVGNTPLVQLRRYLQHDDIELIAKLELFNPGGSAKDRPALQMLQHAIEQGLIDRNTTVIESSSGNMGIGLAQACRYHRMKFICVVDPHAQYQNVEIMRAYGAEIQRVDTAIEGSYLAARWQRVNELLNSTLNSYWPNQYANEQNPIAHQRGTIREIDKALDGDFDYLFVATSSTGTASGCRDYLRARGNNAKIIAVDAEGSTLFGGQAGPRKIPGLGAGRIPELAQGQSFDEVHRVREIDCVVGCRRMADREAILVGGSAGGVLETVRSMAHRISGSRCVAILHDSGTRYLDTVFSDEWVERETGFDAQRVRELATSNLPVSERMAIQSVSQVAQ